MANTVNDVMNVIASPDYGIKNIAGTNQEILAILSGNHNSKNNIHAIVDDIRNIIQKFVETQTKNKPINIGDTLTKINKKNINNILDEAKGIRKAIDNLAKKIEKQGGKNMPTIAKLTDKASQKVADAMIKNIDEEKKGGGMSAVVDAFNKLKDISLKDIIFGKLKLKHIKDVLKESKDALNIDKKEFDNITKVINAAPEIVKSLSKIGWRIKFIIKSGTIQKLNEILVGKNSILTIANVLKENKKSFEEGQKNAKQVTILVGNLLVSSIYLTIAFFTAGPAILGAKLLDKMIVSIIPVIEKLSESNKQISKASNAAITFIVCTGLLAISSVFLATIAVTGIPALLGSLLLVGIVKLNVLTFDILSKAQTNIIKGAIGMAIMSVSLLLYGIALKKIVDATKNVTLKQILMLVALTVVLVACVIPMGDPIVFTYISVGSIAMGILGLSLIAFGKALDKLGKATKNLKMKQILLVAGSMVTLAAAVGGMAFFAIPVAIGSVTLGVMGGALHLFVKTLKKINDMGEVPTKQVHQVLNVMKVVGNFFGSNTLKLKAVLTAYKYKSIMRPFAGTIKHLAKLNELGVIPMKLVYGALNAMGVIANYYMEKPIEKDVIKQARKYKRMLRPFGKTLKYLTKLKEMGVVPMKLVYGALNAMSVIANYYMEKPIEKDVIKAAKKYKKMLKPFGKTLKYLTKLKEMGEIPMKLVYGALNAMSVIANYYLENPIEKKVIKQARKYKKMLKPFGKTLKHLTKLKEMGEIPMKLVYGALNAMGVIANYFAENPIEKKAIKTSKRYKRLLKPFGTAVKHLSELKNLDGVPLNAVKDTTKAMSYIALFYKTVVISDDAEEKSEYIKDVVEKFNNTAKDINDKFNNIKQIDYKSVISVITTCVSIMTYYSFTKVLFRTKKVLKMNNAVKHFSETINDLKNIGQDFTKDNYNTVKLMLRTMKRITDYYSYSRLFFTTKKVLKMNNVVKLFTNNIEYLKNTQDYTESNDDNVKILLRSMRRIIRFLRYYSLNKWERRRARKNIFLLSAMSTAMTGISNINPSNISSIGDALTNALSGVNTIDISQVKAVTNMFDTFNKINKSENIINKFTESVKEFTTTCKNLMDAMSQNTDAINNIDTNGMGNTFTSVINGNNYIERNSNNTTQTNGIRISNVDEIAKTIAEKINGALSVDVPDTQVQLLINGMGGNEWTITRY